MDRLHDYENQITFLYQINSFLDHEVEFLDAIASTAMAAKEKGRILQQFNISSVSARENARRVFFRGYKLTKQEFDEINEELLLKFEAIGGKENE